MAWTPSASRLLTLIFKEQSKIRNLEHRRSNHGRIIAFFLRLLPVRALGECVVNDIDPHGDKCNEQQEHHFVHLLIIGMCWFGEKCRNKLPLYFRNRGDSVGDALKFWLVKSCVLRDKGEISVCPIKSFGLGDA